MHITQNAPIEALLQAIGRNLENRAKQTKLGRQGLAKTADLNRNTVAAALSGSDIKLSTLIRLTRALGHTDWLTPLLGPPMPTPLKQLEISDKSNSKSSKVKKSKSIIKTKPTSRTMGRQRGRS